MSDQTKTALIVGGAGGIGGAAVSFFTARGWRVYTTYHQTLPQVDPDPLATYIQCDVTAPSQIEALFARIKTETESINTVITAVSPKLKLVPAIDTDLASYTQDIQVMLLGAIAVTIQSLPFLTLCKGTIIHVVSESTESVPPRMSSYITAKMGLVGFIKSAAGEYSRAGIILTGVSPSFVETELLQAFPAKLLELDKQHRYESRFIRPEEIAGALYDIASGSVSVTPGSITTFKDAGDISKWREQRG